MAEQLKARILRMFFKSPTFSTGEIQVLEGESAGQKTKFAGALYAEIGDDVILEGEWFKDPKWGLQFKVASFQFDASPTRDGLVSFIAKDKRFKGIGESRAEKIVAAIEAMGEDFETALQNVPAEQLAIQAGLQPALIETLKKEWFQRAAMNRVMAELAAFQVSPGQAQRLFEDFGTGVVGIVQRDPYWLIGKVRGFGFKTVDKIALSVGVQRDHPSRLREGSRWIISEASREGHTFVTAAGLVHDATKLLCLDNEDEVQALKVALAAMVAEGDLVRAKLGDLDAVWDSRMHAIEKNVAESFIQHGRSRQFVLWREDGNRTEWTREDIHVEFPDLVTKQADAVMAAANWRLSVVSGGAGVGKTYTIDAICRMFEQMGIDSIALCAPTGKAAKRMEESMSRSASTIHMLLGPVFSKSESGETKFKFNHGPGNPLPADLIIVDEVSMVDVRLFDQLFSAIDWERTVVVLVGDHNQLPPVGPGAVLRDIVNRQEMCSVTILDQVHRQAGELKENVSAVLGGSVARGHQKADKTGGAIAPWYVLSQFPSAEQVAGFIEYMVGVRLAQYTRSVRGPDGLISRPIDPIWDVQILSPMRKGDIGTVALNRMIQRIYQRKFGVEVAHPKKENERPKILVHDKVICTRNNYKIGIMNGAMGKVAEVSKEGDLVIVDFEGVGLKTMKGEDVTDLELAYAMTVHKSQGSEYPVVIFICHKSHGIMHHRGLFYTAVSRAREAAIVVGDSWGIKSCAEKIQTDKRRTMMGLGLADMEKAMTTFNPNA